MQNLNPTRIIARQGRDNMLIGSLLLLGGLVTGGFGSMILVILVSPVCGSIILLISAGLIIGGIAMLIRGLSGRKDNDVARAVGDVLATELNERFVFIRNLNRRNLGYVDAILIGPPGALVFRVTETDGILVNDGSDWLERTTGDDFKLSRKNFTRECVTDVYALRNYLAKANIHDVPVFGIIVFTNGMVHLQTRQPVVPIAELRTLMVVLRREYLASTRITDERVQQVSKVLFGS